MSFWCWRPAARVEALNTILDAVLRWEGAITDLVVDSRTVVEFFRSARREGAA